MKFLERLGIFSGLLIVSLFGFFTGFVFANSKRANSNEGWNIPHHTSLAVQACEALGFPLEKVKTDKTQDYYLVTAYCNNKVQVIITLDNIATKPPKEV